MDRKFSAAQLAAAPSAWMPDGAIRRLTVFDVPPMALRIFSDGSPPPEAPRAHVVICPVVASHSDHDVVVTPDGQRMSLRR